jgi:hypothetical protein
MIFLKAALVVNFSQDSDDVILSPLKRKRESAANGAGREVSAIDDVEHKYKVLLMKDEFLLKNCAIRILRDGVLKTRFAQVGARQS